MTEKSSKKSIIIWIIGILAAIGVLCFALFGINRLGQKMTEAGLETTLSNLRRAAASCYALEGRYPESLEYLEENYNLVIDEDKYIVHYEIFASNLMPDITVTAR